MFALAYWAVPRLTGAALAILMLPLAPHVPALVILGALIVVLLAVNVADHLRARKA